MNKKLSAILSVLVIFAFIGYIVYDSIRPAAKATADQPAAQADPEEKWKIENSIHVSEGSMKAIACSDRGLVYAGGDSFINCYNSSSKLLWTVKTPYPVTSLAASGDTILASSAELIIVYDSKGKLLEEWGPFEDKPMITSVSLNAGNAAFADAGNRTVYILDRKGAVVSMIGQNDDQFIVPSPYFDIALDDEGHIFVANTGMRRIEKRKISGELISTFGEPGTAPDAFCGCCNPSHFTLFPGGFVTAEKGLNRIKIMTAAGEFREFVSSKDRFMASIPLDVAASGSSVIYAANPADSKIYVLTRK